MSFSRDPPSSTHSFLPIPLTHQHHHSPPQDEEIPDESYEVPYDDDEIAEDCRWRDDHELQRGVTPFKDELRMNLSGLDTTPQKGDDQPNNTLQPQQLFKSRLSGGEAPAGGDEEWPWPRVVDTWSVVVNQTTPQRNNSISSSTTVGSESTQGGLNSYLHQSSSGYTTDQEDIDTEHEDVDSTSFHPIVESQFVPFGMARLSLSEESDYGQQPTRQQQHQAPHQAQFQHQPPYVQIHTNSNYQQQQQPSPPALQIPQQTQPSFGYQQQPQSQHHQIQQSSQQHQPPFGRHPSPPPHVYPQNNMRYSQLPQQAWNVSSASATMTIPAPVLRANQYQTSSTFSHSTSGPVRGMPTTQVNYNNQNQQQQHLGGGHYQRQGIHSQPLTPVGSFVASTPMNLPYQSHSHPASPRSHPMNQPQQLDPQTTSAMSSYVNTPNLSPLSSPVMSGHPSPTRHSKGMTQTQVGSGQQPSGGGHVRSNSSNFSSVSSSGNSTPTGQVGPPFIQTAQAVFNFHQQQPSQQQQQQQQLMMHIQQTNSMMSNANAVSMMQQQQQHQQSTGHQRRPMPIQTGAPSMHVNVNAPPLQQSQPPQQSPYPHGTLVIKTNLPTISHPSTSSSTPNAPAPILSGDSPTSKARFKTFYRDLWQLAREDSGATGATGTVSGIEKAYEFGVAALKLPEHEKISWKIAMELADLAKRQNHIPRARHWYERAHEFEPLASQVWIEHAKMEEECGELCECERLMQEGLKYCELNEALMIKSIKCYERMGDFVSARAILAKLKDVPLDKVWRTILEGGLMEARLGQMSTARRVFKYLMTHVNWYGPIYSECARVEERWGRFPEALAVVEKGLNQVPRYGPLWFMAFRLIERTCGEEFELARAHAQRALAHVSSELIWKLYFEVAQMEERLGEFERSREAYSNAIYSCPHNLRWKIWLSGARMELLSGDANRLPIVKALLARASEEVPKKMRCIVLLEQSRYEEFCGRVDESRRILRSAQKDFRGEWKVFLESVLLELRAGNIDAAISEAEQALEVHNGTGRLWAILIQLKQKQKHKLGHRLGHMRGSLKEQWAIFKLAIKEVPKSGEVWCEGARLVLNPYAKRYFNLKQAKRFLNFAIQFTPQYGDSFIEYLRLKMILEGIVEQEPETTEKSSKAPSPLYTPADAAEAASTHFHNNNDMQLHPPVVFLGSGRASPDSSSSSTPASGSQPPQNHFQRVSQLCVNAEPNYGSSWFACKVHPLWSPVEVLEVARGMIATHLVQNQHQYQIAILRNWYQEKSRQSTPMTIQQQFDEEAGLDSMPESLASLSPASSKMSLASEDSDDTDSIHSDASMSSTKSTSSTTDATKSSTRADVFSPTTVRIARQIENGELVLEGATKMNTTSTLSGDSSRTGTPDSLDSALLTSEDDEDDLQVEYQIDAEFNSLQILYPPIAQLSVQDKHRCLFGADPITP